ncbi:MAG TPA: hypothetical protein VFX96_13470 [Pyrinomonadaceae bacterium]|nr:hypothetical protein [Pyrinomonadaceae bacterium]
MDWMKGLNDVLQQYNGASPDSAPDTVEDDFDQLTNAAPQSAVADGLSEAFRSEQTPPFPNMLGQVYQQSSGQERANILNTLLAALGPTILSQIMSRAGGSTQTSGGASAGGGILDQILGGIGGLGGGGVDAGAQPETPPQVTPQQAEQIPLEVVEAVAAEAEQRDPSIIDQISDIYARQPTIFKTLGAAALTVALAKIAARANR